MRALSKDDSFNVPYFDILVILLSLLTIRIDNLLILCIHIVRISWDLNLILNNLSTFFIIDLAHFFNNDRILFIFLLNIFLLL